MKLRTLQIALWTAALAATVGFVVMQRSPANVPGEEEAAFFPSFDLADSKGIARTSDEFRGQFLLVFFGFTSCPDICPTTLSEVAQVMDDLGADSARVQPIFISVDPERDRRLGLAEYTEAFHPSILGLAGTEVETRAAAASFKIFYANEDDPNAPDGYTMSHTPGLFLIGPDGAWLRQYAYGTPAADILSDLQSRF